MTVMLNGEQTAIDAGASLAAVLRSHGWPEQGIAVAVDGTVVPRSRWEAALSDGAVVEVVSAVQGG